MSIRIACRCGRTPLFRENPSRRTFECPFCGQTLQANPSADEGDAAAVEQTGNAPRRKSREWLLWIGLAVGLAVAAMISISLFTSHRRSAANREVRANIAKAETLLGDKEYDEAINLLETTLTTPNATDFLDVEKRIDTARSMKLEAADSRFIDNVERSLNDGDMDRAVESLQTRVGRMKEPNKSRAQAIIENVTLVASPDFIATQLENLSDEEIDHASATLESLTAKLPTNYRVLREQYRHDLSIALPAERTRRAELRRRAESARLARLEQERLETAEKERRAKVAEEKMVAEKQRLTEEAEEKAIAEKKRLAEEQDAQDEARLAAEARRKRAFRGIGQQATSEFPLSEGLAIVSLKHRGSSNFIVSLLNDRGDQVESLSNVIGSCSMSRAIRVDNNGDYLLNVKADGPWQILIAQPLPHRTAFKFRFAGEGTTATEQFRLDAGLCKIRLAHRGNANFIVRLLDDQGKYVESVVNEIGDFGGSQAVKIEKPGTYIFDVTADGPWSMEFD